MVYKSNALAAGGASSGTGGGTVSDITSSGGTIAVTNPTGPTTNIDIATNTANTLAGFNNSGVFSDVSIGTNLNIISGVLSASAISAGNNITITYSTNTIGISSSGGGSVSSVFGRTGAVSANYGDYAFNLISGVASVSQGGTGVQTLPAHGVLLGEGTGNVSAATTGTTGRLLIDQGSADPLFKPMSGDAVIAATGAITLATVNSNVGTFGSSSLIPSTIVNAKGLITAISASTVTAPAALISGTTLASNVTASSLTTVGALASGSLAVGFTPVSNALLANSAITIGAQTGLAGGGPVALGSAITISMGTGTANSLAGYNSSGVFADVSVGTNLNLVSGVLGTSSFSAGSNISITYSTKTIGITATSGGSGGSINQITSTGGTINVTNPAGPTTNVDINLANANTWTATQTGAVSGGASSLISQGCIEFSIFANGNSGSGTPTLKWGNGNIQSVTITGACTLGFTLPTSPGRLTIVSTMSATTGFPYTYAGTVLWPGGTIPTFSSISNAIDITSFLYDGNNVYGIANTGFLT